MRHELGVPTPPGQLDIRGWLAVYRNVRTRLHALLDLIDPSATPKDRRLPPDVFAARLKRRQSAHSEEEWAERARRLEWFINQIIEMSIQTLPRDVRRRWKGSRPSMPPWFPPSPGPIVGRSGRGKGVTPLIVVHSADSDGGWYVRNPTC